jgi:hypothetical protein
MPVPSKTGPGSRVVRWPATSRSLTALCDCWPTGNRRPSKIVGTGCAEGSADASATCARVRHPHQQLASCPRSCSTKHNLTAKLLEQTVSRSDSSRPSLGRCLRPQLEIAVTGLSNARSGCTLPVPTRPSPTRLHSTVTFTSDGSRKLRLSPAFPIALRTSMLGICKSKFVCSERRAIQPNPSVSRKVANLAHSVYAIPAVPSKADPLAVWPIWHSFAA